MRAATTTDENTSDDCWNEMPSARILCQPMMLAEAAARGDEGSALPAGAYYREEPSAV